MERNPESRPIIDEPINNDITVEEPLSFEEFRAQQQINSLEKENNSENYYDVLLDRLNTARERISLQRKPITESIPSEAIDSFDMKYQRYLNQVSSAGDETDESSLREMANRLFQELKPDEISYLYMYAGELELHYEIENEKEQYRDIVRLLSIDWQKFLLSPELKECENARYGEEERAKQSVLGEMSLEELKMLREQHAKYVLNGDEPIIYSDEDGKIDYDGYDKNREIKGLWDADEGWFNSDEYHKCINEHPILRHPEIYFYPDEEKISEHIDKVLARVSDTALQRIYSPNKSYRDGVKKIVRYLAGIFQLEKQPNIEYNDKYLLKVGGQGGYQEYRHTILLKNKKSNSLTIEDVNIISHEMWHAYQHMIARNNNKDADPNSLAYIYNYNFKNYIPSSGNYIDAGGTWANNLTQFVEVEARIFGKRFTEKFEEANNKQNLVKKDDVVTSFFKKIAMEKERNN